MIQIILSTLIDTLNLFVQIYIFIIIISALISWVQPNPYNPIVQLLHRLSAPSYRFVKRFFNPVIGGIDLTPIVIIIGLQLLLNVVVYLLGAVAYALL